MATLEEIKLEVAAEVEAVKPLFKQMNGVRSEFTELDYENHINNIAQVKFDNQQNAWLVARVESYGSVQDQLDMMYWDSVNGTTVWADHIAQVKSDNPKPA